MRALSLFSGIGGIDLAAQWAGIETVAFCEQNEFCQKVLARHWPGKEIYDDVRSVNAGRLRADNIPAVDIVFGGPPCQSISNAGKRLGLDDDRFLWPDFLRVCREVRPRWVVAENPPAILTANGGKAFASVLGTLVQMGYDATWGVWGACDVGAPHQRERLFLVAHLSSERCDPWGAVAGLRRQADDHGDGASDVDDSTTCRLEEFTGSSIHSGQFDPSSGAQEERIPQSGVGRGTHGLPTGLARHRWPAGPGSHQHPGEPPRIIKERVTHHAERLKALGNAVVPQQIYPVFQAIMALEASVS